MDKITGGVITDHFKIGDKVRWITVNVVENNVKIAEHVGIIKKINGSKALVLSDEFSEKRWISLFELEVEKP